MHARATRRPIDVCDLRERLRARSSSWHVIDVVASTGSTNADLLARAQCGEDIRGRVLIAEHQTAGRGRNGRIWSGVPRAQIAMSVGVPVDGLPAAAWGWVPLITGLAVVDAIGEVTGIKVGLKWPNDVLSVDDGRKLAGILAEVATPAVAIVVGVGVNVSLGPEELPEATATSLSVLGVDDPDRGALIESLLEHLTRRVETLTSAGGANARLIEDYVGNSLTISSRVRATLPGDRQVVGHAHSIDDHGRLRIDTGVDVTVVSAGDIVHLRPV